MKNVECIICGGSVFTIVCRPKGRDIVRCRSCGLVMLDTGSSDMPQDGLTTGITPGSPTEIEDILSRYLEDPQAFSRRCGFEARLAGISRYVSRGTVLDVGCRTGIFLDYMRSYGWRTCGVESCGDTSRLARLRLGLDVFEGPLEELSLPPESFDVITFYQVLEHMSDPLAALKKACHLIKPGGLLVVEVPNLRCLNARLRRSAWLDAATPGHLFHFTPETLRRIALLAGFSIHSLSTGKATFSIPVPRSLPAMLAGAPLHWAALRLEAGEVVTAYCLKREAREWSISVSLRMPCGRGLEVPAWS